MSLSDDLVMQFVKATNDAPKKKGETTVYGTIRVIGTGENAKKFVKIDGAEEDMLTPISTTANVRDGERVTVLIKNHTAIVNGNIDDPSGSLSDVTNNTTLVNSLSNILEVDHIEAKSAVIEDLRAKTATIDELIVKTAKIEELEADLIDAEELIAEKATIGQLDVEKARIDDLIVKTAKIDELEVSKLDANFANIDFANMDVAVIGDLYAKSGIIENLIISDSKVTGELHGVTIRGDLIDANTIKADKLVVKGKDGFYYRLNVDTEGVEVTEKYSEEELQNGLLGSVIIAKSITATQIAVDDLVAFDATIGGFNISNSSLYSGSKTAVDADVVPGIYMDKDGQFAVGDSNNYLKCYKDGKKYVIDLSANSIKLGASGKDLETALDDIEIGGRNLLLASEGERTIEKTGDTRVYTEYAHTPYLSYLGSSKLIVSFYAKSNTNGVIADFVCVDKDNNIVASNVNHTLTTEYQRYTAAVELYSGRTCADIAACRFRIPTESPVGSASVKNIKFEIGNKATDWTPAPEDVDADIANIAVGARNLLYNSGAEKTATRADSNVYIDYDFTEDLLKMNEREFMFSFDGKGSVDGMNADFYFRQDANVLISEVVKCPLTTKYARYATKVLLKDGYTCADVKLCRFRVNAGTGTVSVKNVKLEKGNKATDWTPAPEEMATDDDLNEVKDTADRADAIASDVESRLTIAEGKIQALVSGADGKTLLTQTDEGWTFTLDPITSEINKVGEDVSAVSETLDNTNTKVNSVESSVSSLTPMTDYVHIGTVDDGSGGTQPCLELGKIDNDAKLRLTNTDIEFVDGDAVPAHINGQKLYISKAEVTDELQFGGFAWQVRSSGNMGLVWKGGAS